MFLKLEASLRYNVSYVPKAYGYRYIPNRPIKRERANRFEYRSVNVCVGIVLNQHAPLLTQV